MSHILTVMVTEVTILYNKSGQRTVPFLTILTLQVLAGFGNWKETGNTIPLKELTSCLKRKRCFFSYLVSRTSPVSAGMGLAPDLLSSVS